jgi:predicted adenine nucleotide alpha hydrolase (AANH) superfamily ATPase
MRDEYGLREFLAGMYKEGEVSPPLQPGGAGLPLPPLRGSAPQRPARCAYCYRLRLEAAAREAKERGYDAFSTTLLISPYQDHELLRETGEAAAERHSVAFAYRDFRPQFRAGQAKARTAGYYLQKYCGCIFSEEERYTAQLRYKPGTAYNGGS